MIQRPIFALIALLAALSSSTVHAAITLPPFFSDHMVLQRGINVPVWGKAGSNEKITVEYAGKTATGTADKDGNWSCKLPPLQVGDASSMTIKADGDASGGEPIVLKDVLVGDVWICSGQSNMQMAVKSCNNAEKEIAEGNYPNIRLFRVPMVTSVEPKEDMKDGKWAVCSPQTVGDFTAAGYFFARGIRARENVPVGLIDNSWGGMPAESFTSFEVLDADSDYASLLAAKKAAMNISQADRDAAAVAGKAWDEKYIRKDPGNDGEKKGWAKADFKETDWKTMQLPRHWEDDGLKIDGSVWFRKTVELPPDWKGKEITLSLGGIDDFDTTYVNGKQVGKNDGPWAIFVSRSYPVPADLTKSGKLAIAVRVFDRNGTGGFYGPPASMNLLLTNADRNHPISLAGPWKYNVEKAFEQTDNTPPRPGEPTKPDAPSLASNIYNAMVKPLIGYGIKGAIWYQGESNAGRAQQYRKLFPAMIKDWRDRWGSSPRSGQAASTSSGQAGDFPFYFVQLANFGNFKARPDYVWDSGWAELREAQTLTLNASPNTGMAVIIDIGDTKDIHPKNKQDVGKRLALCAEHYTYGKNDVESFGPMYESSSVEGGKIRLKFKHASGLEARGGDPKSFAIAGENEKFHWADAKIEGDEIVVSSKDVANPKAVRYAWEDDPQVNVYNGAGLPICPFRTDDWLMTTSGKK